jgi:solute carrier family 50 protein (sugar transporter)
MVNVELLGDIFGWVGMALGIYFFISPAVPFYNLIKGKINYTDAPGLLLVFTFINEILWLIYGLLVDKPQIYYTNGIGGGFTVIFITIFLSYYSKEKIYLTAIFLILLVIIMATISYLGYFMIYYEYVGYAANAFNVGMYAATGEKIYRVFKTKNYKLMPIYSIIGAFLCTGCWIIYGTIIYEINVLIPNGLGMLFAIIQLIVYFYFYCSTKKEKKNLRTETDDDKLI